MKYYLLYLSLFTLFSCESYSTDLVELKVKTSIADCEEENIHIKCLEVYKGKNIKKGEWLLPMCQSKICDSIFYKMNKQDTNLTFTIKGYLSKQGHDEFNYGCIGTHKIKVIEVKQ